MKKRIMTIIFLFMMIFICLPTSVFAEDSTDNTVAYQLKFNKDTIYAGEKLEIIVDGPQFEDFEAADNYLNEHLQSFTIRDREANVYGGYDCTINAEGYIAYAFYPGATMNLYDEYWPEYNKYEVKIEFDNGSCTGVFEVTESQNRISVNKGEDLTIALPGNAYAEGISQVTEGYIDGWENTLSEDELVIDKDENGVAKSVTIPASRFENVSTYSDHCLYIGIQDNPNYYFVFTITPKKYTLSFDTLGGTEISDAVYDEGRYIYLNWFDDPTKEGYEFDGWYDAAEGGLLIETVVMDADQTVYAHWKEKIQEHVHNYGKKVVKATTSKDGSIMEICSDCGDIKQQAIIPKVSDIKLSTSVYTYDGKVKTPALTVKDREGNKLVKNQDYTVTVPKGRKNLGTYTYKITLKGNYSGSKSLTLKIEPVKTSITKVTPASKGFTVKWSAKSATQVSGYQIQYANNSTFSKAKTIGVTSSKTSSKKISGLTAKKTYYVRVRTYKKMNGKTYYSKWSASKTVKTK